MTALTHPSTSPHAVEPVVLTGCDRDPAEPALVFLVKGNLETQFCGHHYGEHEPALRGAGWSVVADERPAP